MIPPIHFRWDGDAMIPLRPKYADHHYVVGEVYCFVEHSDRSEKSHRHFFASLTEIWKNLPEHLSAKFPTMDAMRHEALIRTGWRNERQFVAANNEEAVRLLAFLRKGATTFAIYSANDNVLIEWTAKSQSYRAMGKADFQKSKDDVLAWCSALIGTDVETVRRETGRAA